MPIFRRKNCIHTASGIFALCKRLHSTPVESRLPDMPQMTIRRMHIACWIPKATDTHSGYVILIAFPLQQHLYERASIVRYTYIACFGYVYC